MTSSPYVSSASGSGLPSNQYQSPIKNTKRSSLRGSTSNTSSTTKKSYANGINGLMNPALLSNIALAFRATVNLGVHVKGALEYPESFTGIDAVVNISSLLVN